jgi:hypothetical protein
MEEIEKAVRYLNSVEWPKDLGVRYNIHRDRIVLYIKKLDWILLPPEDVVKAEDIVNRTMTWLNANGYPTILSTE